MLHLFIGGLGLGEAGQQLQRPAAAGVDGDEVARGGSRRACRGRRRACRGRRGGGRDDGPGAVVGGDGLVDGVEPQRRIGGLQQVGQGAARRSPLDEVVGQQRGHGRRVVGPRLLDQLGHAQV